MKPRAVFVFISALWILVGCGGSSDDGGGAENRNPVAVCTANPLFGMAPLSVAFDATPSSDPDGTLVGYTWAFGDGEIGSGMAPSHTYHLAGTYTATLTVIDDDGATDTDTATITVSASPVNEDPTASFTATPTTGTAPLTVDFDASASSDPDGTVVSYTWAFGDGEIGSAMAPSHTYDLAGTYTATLTVTDDDGATDTDTATVTVSAPPLNQDPSAAFSFDPLSGEAPLTVDFDASASSDPDGTVVAYAWAFGDGDSGSGVTTNHTYDLAGSYSVVLTVTDDLGATGASTSTLTVRAPGVPPPDPADVAPPIDPSAAATLYTETEFLFTGTDPVQTGVASGAVVPRRTAVLRGRVNDRAGAPVSGVRVTVLDHPELGQTLTRADGMFDLVVNGGGKITIEYRKTGYLPVQRSAEVPWQDFLWLPDVVLVTADPAVTEVAMNTAGMQVARGSAVLDDDGERRATLLIPEGTGAFLVLGDGTTLPLATASIRATEYTVGDTGPEAMPAELPPTTAYTYALEYTVDEAAAAGAVSVTFDQPVYHYVENFLDFPVGQAVPTGYYDRQRAEWVASRNGRVIEVLDTTGGTATLDTDGDGAEDDAATLAALGFTAAERERLAALYAAGQTLWRVPLTHFTPWDCNWPYGPPGGATGPGQPGGNRRGGGEDEEDPCAEDDRCVIEFQGQVLGESLPVVGTPFTLNYRSNRAPGFADAYTLDIPLSGASVPAPLKRIELTVEVAGQRHPASGVLTFPPDPNQSYTFTWDGRDGYGRRVQGERQATMRVGYVYDAVYLPPAAFDEAFTRLSSETVDLQPNQAREEVTAWQTSREMVGAWDARGPGLGGWTLSANHAYNPADGSLRLGSGETRRGRALGSVIHTYAGGGTVWQFHDLPPGGIPATEVNIHPRRVTPAPDGSLYVGTLSYIFRVDPEGFLTHFAGAGWPDGFSGDGGPATEAQFDGINGMDLAPDGSLYLADARNARVRRIDTDGIVTTVAGTGEPGFAGDGGPAIEAQLYGPLDVAVAPDGGYYIAQATYPRIRHVGPDGIITTVAGGDPDVRWGEMNEGGLATGAYVVPYGLALGPDGTLYFGDDTDRIRRVTPDGIVTTVAGTGHPGYSGDGGPAAEAAVFVGWCFDFDVTPDGSLYFPDEYNHRIRKIDSRGIITTVAGSGDTVYDGSDDGALAGAAATTSPQGVAVAADTSLFTAEYSRARRVAPPAPGTSAGDSLVASKDGRQVYRFDAAGRHQSTVDALNGALIYRFDYDGDNLLHTVTDAAGNVTMVERDGDGTPTALVAPGGQRTLLGVNADGYLTTVTTPVPASWSLSYQAEGLLAAVTDPNGDQRDYTYDASGRLVRDDDPEGGYLLLSRETFPEGFEVTATSAEGRVSTYRVETHSDGSRTRTNTFADGSVNTMVSDPGGTSVITAADGTVSTLRLGPDPRFGMLAPLAAAYTEVTPAGLTLEYTQTREVTLDEAGDPLRPMSVSTTQTLNGGVFTTRFSAAEGTLTRTTIEGRQLVTTLDEHGRPVQYTFATLEPVRLVYGPRGYLTEVRRGAGDGERVYTLAYDAEGYLTQVTDPLGGITAYALDAAGRVTESIASDGGLTAVAYDDRGNLVAVTPPGGLAHTLVYNRVQRLTAHDPPDAPGSTAASALAYNLDRQLISHTRPDGRTIALGYDTGGRLDTAVLGHGTTTYEYVADSGRLSRALSPSGEMSYSYDGSLVTQMLWSGTITGQLDRTFDDLFRAASCSVNGGDTVVFTYDLDGLLTAAGDLSIERDPATGLVTGTTMGTVTDAWGYNGFGELASYAAAPGGEAWELTHTRDLLGRIVGSMETRGTATDNHGYAYDPAGRLVEVTRNGIVVAAAEYDANGNRVTHTGPSGVRVAATYDAQDRLVTLGTATYTYRADGSLQSRSDGGEVTTYEYDELGNLRSVVLPGGDRIDYVIDGRNRRVGREVNGVLTRGFLYKDSLRPVAELDGAGSVVSRFVYGTRANVPDYLVHAGIAYRILCDHLGSPRFVVNATTGTVAQYLAYDAFGRVETDTNPGFQPFGFAGGLYDPDTGLVRFGARDYDPGAGRWTAPDPALFAGGSANLYTYAANDPVNRTDPSGLADDPCEKQERDCDGGEDYRSESRDLEWRRRLGFEVPYWLDSVVGFIGDVASTASAMPGASLLSGAGSALGVLAWPVAFESSMQTGNRVAEVLVEERVERDMEQLDELWREATRDERRPDCP